MRAKHKRRHKSDTDATLATFLQATAGKWKN
jgi:hypothetical protein